MLNPMNQLMPQLQQLNKLWDQTSKIQQNSYTDYAAQHPMMGQTTNPYGDYASLRSKMAQTQAPAPELASPAVSAVQGGGGNLKGYKVTSAFGGRKDPITGKQSNHKGIDLGMAANTKLTSPVDGVVVETKNSSSWGNTVVIRDSAGNLHRYAHMNGINVKPGQKVGRGAFVGVSGNTGRSTGAHLHYEVTNAKGSSINPSMFF